jgi:prevent-host-death family protein
MVRKQSATMTPRVVARDAAAPYAGGPSASESLGIPGSATALEVGVRELRDHLSGYLERVKDGAELTVTEHGRPIARLVATGPADRWEELVARGLIRPALHPATDIDLDRLPEIPGFSLADYLVSLRDAEYEAMSRGPDDVSRRVGDREDPPPGG